jgi:hypothetical protein
MFSIADDDASELDDLERRGDVGGDRVFPGVDAAEFFSGVLICGDPGGLFKDMFRCQKSGVMRRVER